MLAKVAEECLCFQCPRYEVVQVEAQIIFLQGAILLHKEEGQCVEHVVEQDIILV